MGVGMGTPKSNLRWRRSVLAVLLGTVMVLGCSGSSVRAAVREVEHIEQPEF